MSNNFRKTAVLKKNVNSKISYKAKDCTKIWGLPVLNFLKRLRFRFSIYLSVIFNRTYVSYRQMALYRKFAKSGSRSSRACNALNFFSRILRSEGLVENSYFIQTSRSTKIIDIRF